MTTTHSPPFDISAPIAEVPPPTTSQTALTAPLARPKRSAVKTAVIAAITGLLMLLAGIGIGYAANAGARNDLSTANTTISSLTADKTQLTNSQTAAKALAGKCTTAAKASIALNAQWQKYSNDVDAWLSAPLGTQAQETAAMNRLDAEYQAIQKQAGSVDALMAQCTTTTS